MKKGRFGIDYQEVSEELKSIKKQESWTWGDVLLHVRNQQFRNNCTPFRTMLRGEKKFSDETNSLLLELLSLGQVETVVEFCYQRHKKALFGGLAQE